MTLVVDPSVCIKWFVAEELRAEARALEAYGEQLVAPDLLLPETANIVWKKQRRGEITYPHAQSIIDRFADFFTQILPSRPFLNLAFEISFDLDHPLYDCLYLACAQAMDGLLVTADKSFVDAAQTRGYSTHIHYLGDPLQPEAET